MNGKCTKKICLYSLHQLPEERLNIWMPVEKQGKTVQLEWLKPGSTSKLD